jgi:hypothetical protein
MGARGKFHQWKLENRFMTSRRNFIKIVPIAGMAAIAGRNAFAADLPMLDSSDPQAAALGYVPDATKANKAKYPTYAAGQHCGVCVLYQGTPGAKSGPCPLYPGKQVSVNGWCSSWAKKG